MAVELIASSDVSPWNLLHDGSVVGVERRGSRVSLTIEIPYLRRRFAEPGAAFLLELSECSALEYTPYEGEPTTSLERIVDTEPEIVEAKNEDDCVVVWGSGGVLRLRYRDLALRFDSGSPLALAALDECARNYWDEWAARHNP